MNKVHGTKYFNCAYAHIRSSNYIDIMSLNKFNSGNFRLQNRLILMACHGLALVVGYILEHYMDECMMVVHMSTYNYGGS